MKKIIYYIFLTIGLLPVIANAASLGFAPNKINLDIGEAVSVDFLLSSDEGVNAVEGRILVPSGLSVEEVFDGNSIISLWIQRPKITGSAQGTEISFAGVVPGGYYANNGKIISFKIMAKTPGLFLVKATEIQAFINDGAGTKAGTSLSSLSVSVSSRVVTDKLPDEEDKVPPEQFQPQITNDPEIYSGKWFLVFTTQDKGSGINHYEVAEARGFLRPTPVHWELTESPYVLKDQELKSWLFVKAVDSLGNERIALIRPEKAYTFGLPLALLSALLLAIMLYILFRKRRK